MDPGNVILTPSIWHYRYDSDGQEIARVSYKPIRKTDCFVLLSLGTAPKGTSPAEHAMAVLQELGWTPPAALGDEAPTPQVERESSREAI